jgi:hypothetical protein
VTNVVAAPGDRAQIWVKWETQRSLMLIEGVDHYRIIGRTTGPSLTD